MKSLLAIAVGPVQEFIFAARRTRDLWYGSWILAEISKAAAKSVRDSGGELIFPAPESAKDLDPDSSLTPANVILALVDAGAEDKIAGLAKGAARKRWRDEAERALSGEVNPYVDRALWEKQVDDVVEYYAAWGPAELDGSYSKARARVTRLLAGRKALRSFDPTPADIRYGIPKSSLDGARESVLKPDLDREDFKTRLGRDLRLNRGEELDVVGLTKRLARVEYRPSVTRIAPDPWLRGIAKSRHPAFMAVMELCGQISNQALIRYTWPFFKAFPFEGTAVFRSRYGPELIERGADEKVVAKLAEKVKDLEKAFGPPQAYYALLAADGDRMGRAISLLRSAPEHQDFSKTLAGFAATAKATVTGHNGCLVFAGGDDVLAFLPLDKAIECAAQLAHDFESAIGGSGEERPTLSVGIAIGHFLEPLEDMLLYARAAEKHAKDGDEGDTPKNGLAIHLHTRGGAPLKIRDSWTRDPAGRLAKLAEAHQKNLLPDKAGYELRRIAERYGSGWPGDPLDPLRRESFLLIERKKNEKNAAEFTALRDRIENSAKRQHDFLRVADEMILARRIAEAKQQAEGKRHEPD